MQHKFARTHARLLGCRSEVDTPTRPLLIDNSPPPHLQLESASAAGALGPRKEQSRRMNTHQSQIWREAMAKETRVAKNHPSYTQRLSDANAFPSSEQLTNSRRNSSASHASDAHAGASGQRSFAAMATHEEEDAGAGAPRVVMVPVADQRGRPLNTSSSYGAGADTFASMPSMFASRGKPRDKVGRRTLSSPHSRHCVVCAVPHSRVLFLLDDWLPRAIAHVNRQDRQRRVSRHRMPLPCVMPVATHTCASCVTAGARGQTSPRRVRATGPTGRDSLTGVMGATRGKSYVVKR